MTKKEIIGICEFLKIHHFENAYTLLDYIDDLQQENQQLKKQKDDVVEYIKSLRIFSARSNGKTLFAKILNEILRMLGEEDE